MELFVCLEAVLRLLPLAWCCLSSLLVSCVLSFWVGSLLIAFVQLSAETSAASSSLAAAEGLDSPYF